jgi:ankyrin repeat protein
MMAYDAEVTQLLLDAGARTEAVDDVGQTALVVAASVGRFPVVRTLLERRANPHHVCQGEGISALARAASVGDAKSVALLLSAGADPRVLTNDGREPLAMASTPAVAHALIAARAHINQMDGEGLTPLSHATLSGHVQVALTLLAAGAFPHPRDALHWTPLMLAVQEGHGAIVDAILAIDSSPERLNRINADGQTAIVVAATNGRVDLLRRLISARADVHVRDKSEMTAIMHAANARTAHVLLAAGAQVDDRDELQRTAFMWAGECGDPALLELLLRAGSAIDAVDDEGRDALMAAANNNQPANVRAILRLDVDAGRGLVATSDCAGASALELSVNSGDADSVGLILAAGANANARRLDGLTPLMAAPTGAVAEQLLEARATINAIDMEGRTALMVMCCRPHALNAAQFLLSRSPALLTARDSKGHTALAYAVYAINAPAMQLLLHAGADLLTAVRTPEDRSRKAQRTARAASARTTPGRGYTALTTLLDDHRPLHHLELGIASQLIARRTDAAMQWCIAFVLSQLLRGLDDRAQ